jgi:hypothetical protein
MDYDLLERAQRFTELAGTKPWKTRKKELFPCIVALFSVYAIFRV